MDMPPQTTALLGHIYNWLQTVGYPVRTFTGSYQDSNHGGAVAVSYPGAVAFDDSLKPGLDSVAARLGKRGGISWDQEVSLRLLMHEALHQMRYGRGDGSVDEYEEGATEAATHDLLPIFVRKMYGANIGTAKERDPSYKSQTTTIRQLSTFGSGARKFTDRPARVWRRTFLHSDTATRQKMVADATAKRVEWGKVTGR